MIPIPFLQYISIPTGAASVISSYTYSSADALQGCDISYDSSYVYCMISDNSTNSYVYFFNSTTGILSHTISVPYPLKSLQMFSDGYFKGVTRGVANLSRYIQISSTGSNSSILYSNTGTGFSNVNGNQALMTVNNRIYVGSQGPGEPVSGDHVFSASASLSTKVESNNFSATNFNTKDLKALGSDQLLILTSNGASITRITKVSVPTYSITSTDINTIWSPDNSENQARFDYDGSDIVMAAVSNGVSQSQVLKYVPSTEVMTSAISLSSGRITSGMSYCSSNKSFYFSDRDISGSGFTFSVNKTTDLTTFSTTFTDINAYNAISAIKYIPSLNSICVIYNKLDGSIVKSIKFIGL